MDSSVCCGDSDCDSSSISSASSRVASCLPSSDLDADGMCGRCFCLPYIINAQLHDINY